MTAALPHRDGGHPVVSAEDLGASKLFGCLRPGREDGVATTIIASVIPFW